MQTAKQKSNPEQTDQKWQQNSLFLNHYPTKYQTKNTR